MRVRVKKKKNPLGEKTYLLLVAHVAPCPAARGDPKNEQKFRGIPSSELSVVTPLNSTIGLFQQVVPMFLFQALKHTYQTFVTAEYFFSFATFG